MSLHICLEVLREKKKELEMDKRECTTMDPHLPSEWIYIHLLVHTQLFKIKM